MHYRYLILFVYRKGKNTIQTVNKISVPYGKGAAAKRTVQKRFARFNIGDFSTEDQERPGNLSTPDEDLIKTLIDCNPNQKSISHN